MNPEPTAADLELMSEEILELTKLGMLARNAPRKRKGAGIDLSESEFLTLDFLCRENSLTVGELQKRIRVLPAQMSRVIRALESKASRPLISCRINPHDKRRIDVSATDDGRRARQQYRDARLASTVKILAGLDPNDRREFMRILARIRDIMSRDMQ